VQSVRNKLQINHCVLGSVSIMIDLLCEICRCAEEGEDELANVSLNCWQALASIETLT